MERAGNSSWPAGALPAIGLCTCLLLSSCVRHGFDPAPGDGGGRVDAHVADGDGLVVEVDTMAPDLRSGDTIFAQLDVLPAYPSLGAWNDYVRNDDPQLSVWDQSGVACDGSEIGGPAVCIHVGDKKRVVVGEFGSCAGLRLTDTLGVFRWHCRLAGSGVEFLSTLAQGMGLRHLVSGDAWLDNQVVLTLDGVPVGASPLGQWWDNAIIPLPENASTPTEELGQAGAVYTLATSRQSNGYRLAADRVALVVLDGATLTYAGSSEANARWDTGLPGAGATVIALVVAAAQHFVWIEGSLRGGANAWTGVYLRSSPFSTLRGVRTSQFGAAGVMLRSRYSTVNGLYSVANIDRGIWLHDEQESRLRDVFVSNNRGDGIDVELSSGIVLTRVLAVSNVNGLSFGGSENTLLSALLANNENAGMGSWATQDCTFAQVVAANNRDGFSMGGGAGGLVFATIAAAHTEGGTGIWISQSSAHFTGLLLANDCAVAGNTTDPGLEPNTCANQGPSDAKVIQGFDFLTTFEGKVGSEDLANQSDVAGAANGLAVTDWYDFDGAYRAWGLEGALWPALDNRGRCAGDVACRIWDWGLRSTDSVLRERSGAGDTANAPFVDGGPCPAGLDPDVSLLDARGDSFLLNALEIVDDGFGDDDGLCEDGEVCTYAPHIGLDQGAGDPYQRRCTMAAGAFSNVIMHAFP